jgi:CheY-like chemotaxis protein
MSLRTILYVDDDADDRDIFSQAVKGVSPEVNVVFAENGVQALDYLQATLNSDARLPCLMVLDINMPVLDGKETYQRVQKDERLQSLPVIVFTSSQRPADKQLFNSMGVELIVKPSDMVYMNSLANRFVGFCKD